MCSVFGNWENWCEIVRQRRNAEAGVVVPRLRESGVQPEDEVAFKYSCIGNDEESAELLSDVFAQYDQVEICHYEISEVFEIKGASDADPYTDSEIYQWIGFMLDSCRLHQFQFEKWSVTASKSGVSFDSGLGASIADGQRVITDSQQVDILTSRMSGASQTLAILRNRGVSEMTSVPLECFFWGYADTKIAALCEALSKLGFHKEDDTTIRGPGPISLCLTSPQVRLTENELQSFVQKMCKLAAKYDCVFDGWGTQPSRTE